jgi:hypothetical protein
MTDAARITLATLLLCLSGPLVATLFGKAPLRRALAASIAIAAQGIPFLLPEERSFLRALYTLGAFVSFIRLVDLWRDPRSWPLPQRLWLLTALFDSREVRHTEPEVSLKRFASALGYALLMGLGAWLAFGVDATGPKVVLRWLGGALFVYSMVDSVATLVDAIYRSLGIVIPPQHRAPVLSRSVSEFWSKRWNLNVHDWLRRHLYVPLAALGRPTLGVVAVFFASSLLHFWMVYVPLGLYWALPMGAFFLVQGAFIGLERLLRVRRWRRWAKHTWTVSAVLGTSPLFVEPFLRIIHV